MAGREPKVSIKIDGDATGYRAALKQTERDTRTAGGKIRSSWSSIGAGLGGFASAASTALGVVQTVGGAVLEFVQAAADEEQAYARLTPVLTNNLKVTQAQASALLDTVGAMQYGSTFADDELRPAFANLAAVTGDAALATDLLRVAMDASVGSGIPLETVTKALAKAADGNTTSLGKLFPALDNTALKSGDLSAITEDLTEKYGGADKAASDTASGGLQDLSDAYGDMQETLGTELLPYLKDFTEWATSPEGQKGVADMAEAVGALAHGLETLWEIGNKINDFVPDGFLWKFRANPDNYWPDRWPWQNGAAPTASAAGTSTYAARTPRPVPTVLQLDGVTVARAVTRAQATDRARGGTVRTRDFR